MRKAMLLVAAVSVALFACKDAPPPPVKAEPKKPQPVPTDFVMNDFFTDETQVKGVAGDASVNLPDGGSATASAGGGGNASAQAGDARVAKLVEPGAEPRAPRRYTFAAGKPEVRVGQVRVAITVAAPGRPPEEQAEPALDLTMKLSTKGASKGTFPFDVRLEKAALAEGQGLDPRSAAEAQKQLGPLVGLAAKVEISPRGVVGELAFAGDEKMAKPGTAEVLQMVQQTLEFAAVPFPEEPIGVGAKWEMANVSVAQGTRVTTRTVFLLKEWSADGGVITAEIARSAPKSPLRDPRMAGAQVSIDGKGTYTFKVKLDRPTLKVSGESETIAKIDVPKSAKGPAQTITQTIKTKHSLDSPGGK
ncbi:MAG: hypothetical protein IPF92_05425 [Myxococcales bacterium]|nr:hypothetical protein [Myxococcales bacterium]MBL0198009.1 hypothetical protein [Myxococcales bacterium]